ncbi:MAG: D-alanyl-D-alanine carboxypeptidase family protein [Leptolyngbyaceae cyanobacterium]
MEPNFYEPIDDIPEAQRDGVVSVGSGKGNRYRRWLIWFLVGLLSAIAGLVVSWLTYPAAEAVDPVPLQSLPPITLADPLTNTLISTETLGEDPAAGDRPLLLGHRAYEEAEPSDLVSLTYNSGILMRPEAAASFEAMVAAAANQGIYLVPISGFRTVEDQNFLFFEIKAERGQTASTRAEVSAPPGYSEHHTGYAVDIGDADQPATHLSVDFETTAAFRWLEDNAPRYSFELSFPEGNPQGVQYEPWHWRFVGNSESLETFYQAR